MNKLEELFRAAALHLTSRKRGEQARISKEMDIHGPYLNAILKGRKPGTEEIRRKIAAALGYEGRRYEDFLEIGRSVLEGHEPPEPVKSPVIIPRGIPDMELDSYNFLRIPFRDDMRLFAGGGGAVPGTYDSESSPVVVHRDAISFRANPKNLIAFRVGGDSMEPILAKDGIVAVDTAQNDLRRLKDGDIYALCWDDDEECAVKRLRWAAPGQLLAVESADPVVNPTVYLEPEARMVYLIGRVIWSWREH